MHYLSAHKAKKRFGQNFLYDPGIVAAILQILQVKPGDQVVEIGPGQGALTRGLLQQIGQLQAIELDRDLIIPLQQQCQQDGKLILHQADALRFDFRELGRTGGDKLRVVGNLPYNIATPLLFHLLAQIAVIQDMHFMLQLEVAERITAEPGNKNYGKLSILLQYFCKAELLLNVPPSAFRPIPKVQSAVIRLVPYQQLPYVARNFAYFKQIVQQAFQQRRKTLRNNLQGILSTADLLACNIDPGARAETLPLPKFVELANQMDCNQA